MSNRFLLSNGGNVDPPYISWTKTPATAAAALMSGAAAAMFLDRTKNALSTCEKSLVKPLSFSIARLVNVDLNIYEASKNLQLMMNGTQSTS